MDERTKLARSYIKGITTKEEFNSLLDKLFISDVEREVIEDLYVKGSNMGLIADKLGYSAPTVKAIHKRVLIKISSYIYQHTNL